MKKIFRFFKHLYQTVSSLGIDLEDTYNDPGYIRLNNRILMLLSFVCIIFLIFALFFLNAVSIVIVLVVLSFYLMALLLSYYKLTDLSRLLNIHFSIFAVLVASILVGKESGMINFFFPLIIQIFLLHKANERKIVLFYSLLIIISYFFYNDHTNDLSKYAYLAQFGADMKFLAAPVQLLQCILLVFLAFRKYEQSQQELVYQKNTLQNIIDSIPLDVVVIDSQFKYRFVNTVAIQDPVIKYWIIGKSDYDYVKYMNKDVKIAETRRQYLKNALESRTTKEFEEVLMKDGQMKTTLKVITPIINDTNNLDTYLICYSIDITKRKQNEQTIKNYSNELEVKNEELKQFAYITSHDLKSPLRNIITLLQLVRKKNNNTLDKNSSELMTIATDSAEHLYRLVNDILLYSTTDNNNQETEEISIEDIVRSIKQNLTHYLTQKDASIIISKALPTIEAHTTLINNLFHNLIENAIKYNDSEKPTVTIDYEILDQNYLFKISDNGIGIKPEFKELIFVVFKRLHTQKHYEGTGIGLSICKKIVEKYNGNIWLESEEGKGSTFFFTLPK